MKSLEALKKELDIPSTPAELPIKDPLRVMELRTLLIRKRAFDRAEQKWWDCREEIQALEDEQEAAGIGEVVSLTERGGAEGGAGRRR